MYLYHLFHGQAIRVHRVPGEMRENCHREYNDLVILLIIAVILGRVIVCYIFQRAFTCTPSAISSSSSLSSLSLSFKGVAIAIKLRTVL